MRLLCKNSFQLEILHCGSKYKIQQRNFSTMAQAGENSRRKTADLIARLYFIGSYLSEVLTDVSSLQCLCLH